VGAAKARKRKDPAASEPAAPREASPRLYRIHLAAASLLAVLLAFHRYATVMSEPGGRFEDPDAMFHAHRVVRTIADGKLLPPVFDPFENFPDGGRALWPPLHDASLALMARIGGSTAQDPRRGLPVAAAFPVLEVVLALLVAAALAKRAGGSRGGVVAAWLFAVTPCLPRRGSFGDIDHNLTEVLAALLLLLLAGTIVRREEEKAAGGRDPRLSPLLWAAAVLLALGFYTGLVLSAGIVAGAVAVRDLAFPSIRALPRISLGFGLAALLLPFFASLRVTPDPADPWRLGPPYVLILALGATGTGLFSFALAARRGFSKDPDLFAAAGFLAGALALALTSSRAWPALVRGLGFLGSRDPWLATIDEFRPLLVDTTWAGTALPAVPVALAGFVLVLALRRKETARLSPDLLLLATPFAAVTMLTLVQSRFLPTAVALSAAMGGAAWSLLARRGGARAALWGLTLVGLVPAAVLYQIPFLGATFRGISTAVTLPWETAAQAIQARTPDPGSPPRWAVLAPWDFGHAIVFRAARAVALNNFGSMQPGFVAAQKLWLTPSPAKAVRELDRLKVRYVLVVWPPYFVPSAAASLGLVPDGYFEGRWTPENPPAYRPTSLGERTLAVRLHLRDAAPRTDDGTEDRGALARLRPLWSSDEQGPGPQGSVPVQKLFELLPEGAATASR